MNSVSKTESRPVSPRLSERGKASTPGNAPCLMVGCRVQVPIDTLFCARHRALVWDDTYDWLYEKFRPGRKQSKVFQSRLELTREQIRQAEQDGHREPREQTLFVK
jgi:hypothetical protein